MRLLNTDGIGCIASWVRPEVFDGGRKVVLHNGFTGKDRELDREDALILFGMTGNNDPIEDAYSAYLCDSLWKEHYIEKENERESGIMTLATVFQEEMDKEAGISGNRKVDATGKHRYELVYEEAYAKAKQVYNEQWRTYSKAAHPVFWTMLLSVIGVILLSVGPLLFIRTLFSSVSYDFFEASGGECLYYIAAGCAAAFFAEGCLRDFCHGFVGRLFGARVIYKGFLNGSWLHGDWYLIDDSTICGKYNRIQRLHIRLAGSYCDILIAAILSGVLLHTEKILPYIFISGALFGILIRCVMHFCPLVFCGDWDEALAAVFDTKNIRIDTEYFARLFRGRDTRRELPAQKGVSAVGALLVSILIVLLILVGILNLYSLPVFFSGWVV